MTRPLPSQVVVPLGKPVTSSWSAVDGERRTVIAVPQVAWALTPAEFRLWQQARGGHSVDELIERAGAPAPQPSYDALRERGLLIEVSTTPESLLGEASALRLLAHTPMSVHEQLGMVVGDGQGSYYRLLPAVHEVYALAPAVHTLAAAIYAVSGRASEEGSNDLDVILPQRLAALTFGEFFALASRGMASLVSASVAR